MDLKWDPICKHCNARKGDHFTLSVNCQPGLVPKTMFWDSGMNRTASGLVYNPMNGQTGQMPLGPASGLPTRPSPMMPSPMLVPWGAPAPPPLNLSSNASPAPAKPRFKVGDRVIRLEWGFQGTPAGTIGTVETIHLVVGVKVRWDDKNRGVNTYSNEDARQALGLLGAAAKASSVDTTRCDTCRAPNAFDAVANQENGAFRCGQCRAMRQVF